MSRAPVFIRAAGAVTAAGVGLPALRRAVASVDWQPGPGLDSPDGPSQPVATCAGFSARDHLAMLVARRMNRPARLLAVAAREAIAGLGHPLPFESTRFALTSATANAGTSAIMEILRVVFLGNPDDSPPSEFLSTVAHAPASQVAIIEDLRGPNVTFAEKQNGGIRAVVEATRMLRRAHADAVLACGVDEAQWITAEGYRRIGALRRPGSPGLVLGEGATAMAMALTPGPSATARLSGWGSASTPTRPWSYPERADAVIVACQQALAMAGLVAADVDGYCTFANGIVALDRLEAACVAAVFARHRPPVVNVTRLGEGAFAGSLRVLAAADTLSGQMQPRWPAPAHLAALGMVERVDRPRHVLVPGVAGGGSVIAAVLSSA